MRQITTLFLALFSALSLSAQMDDKFYFPSTKMQPIDSLSFEEVVLPADSAQVTGIFLKPAKKAKATVLFFHGAGGNVSRYVFMVKPLVAAGYQVFMVDFRGYGKSTGKPTHLNIAKDGQMVLDYLLKRKDVKKTKLVLYGASIGTQVAANLARNNESKVRALVLDGTVASFSDLAADHSPEAQREFIRKNLPSPYAAKEDVKSLKKIPVLFIHSKEDKDVPFQQAEMVYQNTPVKKKFFIYTGKHLEAMRSDAADVVKEINALVK